MSFQLGTALVSCVTGLVAARYWRESTKIRIPPISDHLDDEGLSLAWLKSVRDVSRQASYLNGIAARWTAFSVACGGVSAVLGALPSN